MRISERVDLAVRAMAELAARPADVIKADVIAQRQGIAVKYLLDPNDQLDVPTRVAERS